MEVVGVLVPVALLALSVSWKKGLAWPQARQNRELITSSIGRGVGQQGIDESARKERERRQRDTQVAQHRQRQKDGA